MNLTSLWELYRACVLFESNLGPIIFNFVNWTIGFYFIGLILSLLEVWKNACDTKSSIFGGFLILKDDALKTRFTSFVSFPLKVEQAAIFIRVLFLVYFCFTFNQLSAVNSICNAMFSFHKYNTHRLLHLISVFRYVTVAFDKNLVKESNN